MATLLMDWFWAPPTVVALFAFLYSMLAYKSASKVREDVKTLHVQIDGQLTELLETTRALAERKGHAAGVEHERSRREAADKDP